MNRFANIFNFAPKVSHFFALLLLEKNAKIFAFYSKFSFNLIRDLKGKVSLFKKSEILREKSENFEGGNEKFCEKKIREINY